MIKRSGVTADKSHNGWPNYETWAMSLWLDSSESSYRRWREVARQIITLVHAPHYSHGSVAIMSDATVDFAERLRCALSRRCPRIGPSVFADLQRSGLNQVDWNCIAEHILNDLKETEIDASETATGD